MELGIDLDSLRLGKTGCTSRTPQVEGSGLEFREVMAGRERIRVVVGNSMLAGEADSSTLPVAVDRQPVVAATQRSRPRAEEDSKVRVVAPPRSLARAAGTCIVVVAERI